MAAQVGAELAEIAEPGGPAVEETSRSARLAIAAIPAIAPGARPSSDARRLRWPRRWRCRVHARTSARRLPAARCSRSRRRTSARRRPPSASEADVEAARGRDAGRAQCARSSSPCHASSPSGKPSRRFVSTRSMPLIGKKFRNMKKSDRFTGSSPRRAMLGQRVERRAAPRGNGAAASSGAHRRRLERHHVVAVAIVEPPALVEQPALALRAARTAACPGNGVRWLNAAM